MTFGRRRDFANWKELELGAPRFWCWPFVSAAEVAFPSSATQRGRVVEAVRADRSAAKAARARGARLCARVDVRSGWRVALDCASSRVAVALPLVAIRSSSITVA